MTPIRLFQYFLSVSGGIGVLGFVCLILRLLYWLIVGWIAPSPTSATPGSR